MWAAATRHPALRKRNQHTITTQNHTVRTLAYHCVRLPDQSRHVFNACLYSCITRCLWAIVELPRAPGAAPGRGVLQAGAQDLIDAPGPFQLDLPAYKQV